MLSISESDVAARISRDNPWWDRGVGAIVEAKYPQRVYFDAFQKIALNYSIRRAAILLGPRRVGKTVILKQTVMQAIKNGLNPKSILYASVDAPIYAGMPLEKIPAIFAGWIGLSKDMHV